LQVCGIHGHITLSGVVMKQNMYTVLTKCFVYNMLKVNLLKYVKGNKVITTKSIDSKIKLNYSLYTITVDNNKAFSKDHVSNNRI